MGSTNPSRPIPQEMLFYARSDTHFLLYIYDCMRNELIDKSKTNIPDDNKIEIVLQKSKEVSLLRYERLVYNAETGKGPAGWYNQIQKISSLLSNEQFSVFKAVHAWRDKVARLDDDSTNFVMPNRIVESLAANMPEDMVALLSNVRPMSHGVKSRTAELLQLVKSARSQGKNGPSMIDVLRSKKSTGAMPKANPISTVTTESPPKVLLAVASETELRSDQSSFWGGAFGSSVWDKPITPKVEAKSTFSFPGLPSTSYEILDTSSSGLADRTVPQPAAVPVLAGRNKLLDSGLQDYIVTPRETISSYNPVRCINLTDRFCSRSGRRRSFYP
jgi:exosome complex exonuclease RRP6